MIKIIELADDFIRGLYDGSILYYDIKPESLPHGTTWVSHVDEVAKMIVSQTRTRLNQNMQLYLTDPDNQKEHYAKEVFEAVLLLRRYGVIKNNPDSLKELNFYKQGYYDEFQTSDDLRRKLKDSHDKIDELQKTVISLQKGNPIAK